MSPENVICLGTVLFLVFWMVALRISLRRETALTARLAALTAQEPPLLTLDERALRWQLAQIGQRESRRQRGILLMTPTALRLYGRMPELPEMLAIRPDQLRWFGRPHKYTSGTNEIWLHIETETGWQLLKIRLHQQAMQQFVRALKSFAAPELVEAYRRRRPYLHYGPVQAAPAAQDLHGAWTLAAPVNLYLMPRFLVILQGNIMLRKIPLAAVQQVGALQRLDEPDAAGLVRFRAEEETLAFTLENHEAFAEALATAAKRTLEDPIERKQKPKDDDPEYEDWQAEFDAAEDQRKNQAR